MDCGTWLLREPCSPRTALTRRGGRVWVCRSHTDWTAPGRQVHPAPDQPACHDMWMWLTGRMFGTSGNAGVRSGGQYLSILYICLEPVGKCRHPMGWLCSV
jgi:hypothetical protein